MKTAEPCLCYEVFCPPPRQRDDRPNDAIGLFDEGEDTTPTQRSGGTYYIDLKFHGLDLKEIEARPPVNRKLDAKAA